MGNPPRIRKRVFGLRRGPDGSAFQKCESCGVSVPIAIYDMHECDKVEKGHKRFEGENRNKKRERGCRSYEEMEENQLSTGKESICAQPRSAFCIFMEGLKNDHKTEDWRDVDQKGFDKWKCMSTKERWFFVDQAEKVNLAYEKGLLDEVADTSEVNDEADSAMVGKFDVYYENYEHGENTDTSGSPPTRIGSFDSSDWDMVHGRVD